MDADEQSVEVLHYNSDIRLRFDETVDAAGGLLRTSTPQTLSLLPVLRGGLLRTSTPPKLNRRLLLHASVEYSP